uniref:Small ribosomal subunit protein mS31 n=1 Tax=Panagrolaimus superbus TaxID=310955 RepID=A0A914YI41_9BILA
MKALRSLTISRPTLRITRFFSSENNDDDPNKKDPNMKKIVDEKLLDALKNAAANKHPDDKNARSNLTKAAIKRLGDIEYDSFKHATAAQTSDIVSDSVLSSLQGLQVRKPSIPSYSKDMRESNQIRVALRREIFHEAVQKGLSAEEAKQSAEKILPVVEKVIAKRRQEKVSAFEEEIEKQEKEDENLTVLDKHILDKILTKRDNVFYIDEYLLATSSTDTPKPTVTPNNDFVSVFNDSSVCLNIFKKNLKPNNLDFWKQWDDEKARITNLSMGPKNAIEEQILWTEQGKMWPYPIDNEYKLGEEEEISFMDHIFLEPYLAKYNLPKSGPVAHFMELVCVGLSKNPFMSVTKKHEHLDAFAQYFNPQQCEKINELHELEQIAAAKS